MKIKFSFLFLMLFISITLDAQKSEYNIKDGYVANGYDMISYFQGNPQKGDKNITSKYDDVLFCFASQENKNRFDENPEQYIPQYGGWCAYAVAENNSKVRINPKSYQIQDGKLYLFYNKLMINTLKCWNKKGAEDLQKKADLNWPQVKNK